jgi:hypothetical protein
MIKPITSDPAMYVPRMDACINRWFRTYHEAKKSMETEGGYLFPYRNQFFVTESEAVRELGLDPNDSDWEFIGRDWVCPLNREAWDRLRHKRMFSPA